MWIRRLHRTIGIIFAPFFIITGTTGAILLWRTTGRYGHEVHERLIGLHNWEGVGQFVGVILAAGLLTMTVTGVTLRVQMWRRKRRAKS